MQYKFNLLFILIITFCIKCFANLPEEQLSDKPSIDFRKLATDCAPATSQAELAINNVRVTLLNGGDKWWDLQNQGYEIPKVDPASGGTPVYSYYGGAIWIGGLDANGQLKLAAQTFRQSGDDFWPGPLDSNGSVSAQVCSDYDRHWSVLASEINQARAMAEAYLADLGNPNAPVNLSPSDIPQSLLEWPAIGNPYAKGLQGADLTINEDLAPFYDYDGDGLYDPTKGDLPAISSENGLMCADQMIFWTFNDKGNDHTSTGGEAIGIQVNATAFAFSTDDEINDMTFYQYKVINKSNTPLYDTYFANWADPDLGCYLYDYVGCDTSNNLAIVYNGLATDYDCGNTAGYGQNPPISALSLIKSPKDDNGIELGMTSFIYYKNNTNPTNGNPETANHYYNYMQGIWLDSSPVTEGGDGIGGTVTTNFTYPGNPSNSLGWSECSNNNAPGDRRFVQGSGPFTLMPGAVKEVITGVVWVQIPGVYPCPDFNTTIVPANEKALAFFDTLSFNYCFQDSFVINNVFENEAVINELKIYPNPLNIGKILHVEFHSFYSERGEVKLYDLKGNVVLHESISIQEGKSQNQIRTNELAQGVYVISITTDNGNIANKRVVVF